MFLKNLLIIGNFPLVCGCIDDTFVKSSCKWSA